MEKRKRWEIGIWYFMKLEQYNIICFGNILLKIYNVRELIGDFLVYQISGIMKWLLII